MSDVAMGIDWGKARMTQQAINAQKPENRRRVIEVTKKGLPKYGALSWADLEAATAADSTDLEPVVMYGNDIAPVGFAWLREGRSDDGKLRGRSLLYSQGWTKHGNGHSGQFDA